MSPAWRALALSVVLLGGAELGLRATDRGPWAPFPSFDGVPVISDPDPALGWVIRPGEHAWTGPDGPVRVHVATDGQRGRGVHDGARVLFFGGSWTWGYGLTDGDVVTDRLGVLRADLRPENRAVPGYGTLQSAGLAERVDVRDATVVYGFVELHEGRNAGTRAWLRALERSGSTNDWRAVPWARWDGTRLELHPPTRYAHWTASEHLALVDAAERGWIGMLDRFARTKAETTARLMARFRDDVQSRGGRFRVALLDVPTRHGFYTRRLGELGVDVLDLTDVPVGRLSDGHPDGPTHARWARRLAERL